MKADEFISRLQENGALSERLIAKLRDKLTTSGGTLPAESLADFLVQKKHLTREVASQLLEDSPAEASSADRSSESAAAATDDRRAANSATGGEQSANDDQIVSLTPVEDLASLSNITRDSLDVEGGIEASDESLSTSKPRERSTKQKKRERPERRRSEWDSPLLLMGGGGLALLVIAGVTVYYLLIRDTGDDLLGLARDARDGGSISQAISQYERFLEDFPTHPERSPAAVELAMCRLRRATENRSDFKIALEVAEENVRKVENEESFSDAHDELATLLPRIAAGLADQAEAVAEDPAAATPLVEQATRALELCVNTKYVPKKFRDDAEIEEIRDTLARVERRKLSFDDLATTIQTMTEANQAGNTRDAYEAYRTLVKKHPELSSNEQLMAKIAETSLAEQNGIRFQADEQPALPAAADTPIRRAIAVGQRRSNTASSATGTVCVRVDGAIWGLDAQNGQLRWRRFVGFDDQPYAIRVGDDILTRDVDRSDLLLLSSSSGEIRWRQNIGEPFAQPLLANGKAFLAAESGKVYVVDLTSGTRMGHLQFAQRLRVPPAVDQGGKRLYVVGDHSSLYSISLEDLTCLGVHYVGHTSGSVRVAPVAIVNKVAIFENPGVESARLHLIGLDENGVASALVTQARFDGLVVTPPLKSGRRLIVSTDRGQMTAYQIGPSSDEGSLINVATRPASSQQSMVGQTLLTDQFIWVADNQLGKYVVQPTGNRDAGSGH